MASENAKAVAKEVVRKIAKGEQVILHDIIKGQGYSDSVAESPSRVTDTASYKETIAPLAQRLHNEINRIEQEMSSRNLSNEQYKTLADALDKLTKNYQLLSGGETERVSITGINYIKPSGDHPSSDN